ncbi:MAG: glycosyltransferase family 2 protein [Lachnospiraceae bacterium]|nr:glycosyltransferase family 2 protein [Lachnospiraceae bacterium]
MRNNYASVAIPTLNRFNHLTRCLDSLRRSSYAQYTDVYIGLDYPPQDKYKEGRDQIEAYLNQDQEGFAHIYVHKFESNVGPDRNRQFLIDWIGKTHSKFIFSEDDNEFSVNYLEYMNKMLDQYESDESVVAISGYAYSMASLDVKDGCFSNPVYFAAFGFGSWINKYNNMQESMTKEWLYGFYNDHGLMKRLRYTAPNQYCNFVKGMLGYTRLLENDGEVWKMDMTYGLYMYSEGMRMIFPVISKVKNWGYDGSGVNCEDSEFDSSKPITHRNFGMDCQVLDDRETCENIEEVSADDNMRLNEAVNRFFDIPTKELLRTRIAYILSRLFGIETIRKIWNR